MTAAALSRMALAALAVAIVAHATPAVVPGALRTIEGRIRQWSVPTPHTARDPAVHPDGGVYYTVAGADRIARFDPTTGRSREWPVERGSRPHSAAVASDGHVFFAGNGDGTLGELDPATGALHYHRLGDARSEPYSLAIDAKGNVWCTHRAGRVTRLDVSTGRITEYRLDGTPYGIAFDAGGVAWVTRIDADTITAIDPQSGRTRDLPTGRGSKPRRAAVAPDGLLWVSLYGAGKLIAIDPAAVAIVREYAAPGGPNSGPYSVNVDAAGRVWLVEYQTDSIAVLDPARGQFRSIALPDKGSGVRNAALDSRGRYWFVATSTGKIGVVE